MWNTTRSLIAPRSSVPIHAPSMSEGFAGLCSVLIGVVTRLNSSGRDVFCVQVPEIVFASAETVPSYVPWTASMPRLNLEFFSDTELTGIPFAPWSTLSRVALSAPSAPLVMWRTRRSSAPPALSEPCQSPVTSCEQANVPVAINNVKRIACFMSYASKRLCGAGSCLLL